MSKSIWESGLVQFRELGLIFIGGAFALRFFGSVISDLFFVIFLFVGILLLYLGSLFNKKDPKAIKIALGVGIILIFVSVGAGIKGLNLGSVVLTLAIGLSFIDISRTAKYQLNNPQSISTTQQSVSKKPGRGLFKEISSLPVAVLSIFIVVVVLITLVINFPDVENFFLNIGEYLDKLNQKYPWLF